MSDQDAKRDELLSVLRLACWIKTVDQVVVIWTDAMGRLRPTLAAAADAILSVFKDVDCLYPDWHREEFERRYALQRQRKARRVRSGR